MRIAYSSIIIWLAVGMQVCTCYGENVAADTNVSVPRNKPIQFSLYFSTYNGGPHDAIRTAIVGAGFGDDIPDQTVYLFDIPLYTIPGISYPIDETHTRQISLALQQNLYKVHGWFLEFSGMSETNLQGLHITDPVAYSGISLSANSDAALLSFGYMTSTLDGIGMLKIGPSMAFSHTVINCSQDVNISKILPGVHVNGEVHLINKPKGFVGIQMGYRGYRKLQTNAAPLHTFADGTTITLKEITIDYNHIYFGVNAGLNLTPLLLKPKNTGTP